MSDSETVLVTGASGTVGSALVSLLAEQGVVVRAASRRGRLPDQAAGSALGVQAELRDPQSVAQALIGVDRMFLTRRVMRSVWIPLTA